MISSCGQLDWNTIVINIIIKTTGKKNGHQVVAMRMEFSLSYSYVVSYNELEQLHM